MNMVFFREKTHVYVGGNKDDVIFFIIMKILWHLKKISVVLLQTFLPLMMDFNE